MVDACRRAFAQIHRMDNTKSEPEGKLWTLGHDDTPT